VLATTFSNGGKPSQAYMGGTHKQQFSAFTGIADIRATWPARHGDHHGAADVYVSDFGAITLIPHPYGLTRDCLIIDPEMWAVATLDGVKSEALAKTADADQFAHVYEAGPGLPQREVLDGHRRPRLT
jgi:hypothetical protein